MNIIRIHASELLPGDDSDGEIVTTVDVRGDRTYLTYEGDDSPVRVRSADVYVVGREGGVSTLEVTRGEKQQLTPGEKLAIEAQVGDQRERSLLADLRRERG